MMLVDPEDLTPYERAKFEWQGEWLRKKLVEYGWIVERLAKGEGLSRSGVTNMMGRHGVVRPPKWIPVDRSAELPAEILKRLPIGRQGGTNA